MAKYTTEVRSICEDAYMMKMVDDSELKPVEEASINSIIDAGIDRIFWKDEDKFEIYDESHRNELCRKILRHYYTREIGAETFGLWKLWINERMCLIMPYFNEMYESAAIKFNPLDNVKYRRSGLKNDSENEKTDVTRKDKSNSFSNEAGEGENHRDGKEENRGFNVNNGEEYNRYSDTPQNGLSDVKDGRYLTNASVDSKSNSNNSEDVSKENVDESNKYSRNNINQNFSEGVSAGERNNDKQGIWNEDIAGKIGDKSFSTMIKEYREVIINIDNMIIDRLKDLFLLLW